MNWKIAVMLQLVTIILLSTLHIVVTKETDNQITKLKKVIKSNNEHVQKLEREVKGLQEESNERYFTQLENTTVRCK